MDGFRPTLPSVLDWPTNLPHLPACLFILHSYPQAPAARRRWTPSPPRYSTSHTSSACLRHTLSRPVSPHPPPLRLPRPEGDGRLHLLATPPPTPPPPAYGIPSHALCPPTPQAPAVRRRWTPSQPTAATCAPTTRGSSTTRTRRSRCRPWSRRRRGSSRGPGRGPRRRRGSCEADTKRARGAEYIRWRVPEEGGVVGAWCAWGC